MDDSDYLHDVVGKEIKIQHRQELVFNGQCYVKLEDHMKEINALNKSIAELQDVMCFISDIMWGGELGWVDNLKAFKREVKRRIKDV
jgi:hypothetical protein